MDFTYKGIARFGEDLEQFRIYFKKNYRMGMTYMDWEVKGTSNYYLHFNDDGTYRCTCPSWDYSNHDPKVCKHGMTVQVARRLEMVSDDIPRVDDFSPNEFHLDILTWFMNNNIDRDDTALTTRQVLDLRRRDSEFRKYDQNLRGRCCELEKRGYLRAIEREDYNVRLPNDSHYYITDKGKRVLEGTV